MVLVFGAVVAEADILTNGGFETGDLTGWTLDPPRQNADFPGGGEQQEGAVAFREIQSYYGDDRDPGHLYQTVPVPAGDWIVSFSGYAKRYVLGDGFALQPTWGSMTVELTVDDVVEWSETWAADDTWYNFDYTTPAPVTVAGNLDVHLRWETEPGVGSKTFDVVLADGWELSAVPEPGVLLLGAAGLALLRRRR